MKTILLALLTLTIAFEASAQRHSGPRRVSPGHVGPGHVGPGHVGPGHVGPGHVGPGHVVPRPVGPRYSPPRYRRPVIHRTGPVVRAYPRYVYNGNSSRYLRTVVRAPIIWSQPFRYTCNQYEQLMINGSFVHSFNYFGECSQAIQDIRVYGDFCDGEDLYDQSGALEAQFTFDYECRNALGYYY